MLVAMLVFKLGISPDRLVCIVGIVETVLGVRQKVGATGGLGAGTVGVDCKVCSENTAGGFCTVSWIFKLAFLIATCLLAYLVRRAKNSVANCASPVSRFGSVSGSPLLMRLNFSMS